MHHFNLRKVKITRHKSTSGAVARNGSCRLSNAQGPRR